MKPTYLELAFIHSGHVHIRLLARNHWELASAEFHVTDRAAITETMSHWSPSTFTERSETLRYAQHHPRLPQRLQSSPLGGETPKHPKFCTDLGASPISVYKGLGRWEGNRRPRGRQLFAHEAAQQFAASFTATQKLCNAQLATGQYVHALAGYLETTMSKVAPSD